MIPDPLLPGLLIMGTVAGLLGVVVGAAQWPHARIRGDRWA